MIELLSTLFIGAPKLLAFCAAGLAVEHLLRPAEKDQPASAILFNFVWLLHFVVCTNLILLYAGQLVPLGVSALGGPLFTIAFPDTIWGGLGQFALLMLIHDFCYYWFHRCQHTWAWFWAHHKVHHTEVHMNATTSFRHHWMENVYRIPFIFIPMGLVNIDGAYAALAWDVALGWAVFTHLNTRLSMGPLTRIIAGPQVHRLHHSALPGQENRNFAAFFPFWDIIFGTYLHPKRGEFPPTGLVDGEQITSVWQAHTGVFRDWWKLWQQRRRRRAAVLADAR